MLPIIPSTGSPTTVKCPPQHPILQYYSRLCPPRSTNLLVKRLTRTQSVNQSSTGRVSYATRSLRAWMERTNVTHWGAYRGFGSHALGDSVRERGLGIQGRRTAPDNRYEVLHIIIAYLSKTEYSNMYPRVGFRVER